MAKIHVIEMGTFLRLERDDRVVALHDLKSDLEAEDKALEDSFDVARAKRYASACQSYAALYAHIDDPVRS